MIAMLYGDFTYVHCEACAVYENSRFPIIFVGAMFDFAHVTENGILC